MSLLHAGVFERRIVMAKKFLLACFVAIALGAAAGFAMPEATPAAISAAQ
jgi:hypothetical protein